VCYNLAEKVPLLYEFWQNIMGGIFGHPVDSRISRQISTRRKFAQKYSDNRMQFWENNQALPIAL